MYPSLPKPRGTPLKLVQRIFMPMRYYYLFYLSCLFSILMYILGGQDQMNDVVASCQHQFEFVADGNKFVCITSVEYFGENK